MFLTPADKVQQFPSFVLMEHTGHPLILLPHNERLRISYTILFQKIERFKLAT
jgi:hypothetical protein